MQENTLALSQQYGNMDNVYTALSATLIAKKRFVVSCQDSNRAIQLFIDVIVRNNGFELPQDYVAIDLLQHQTIAQVVEQLTYTSEVDNKLYFKNIIIWQNLQRTPIEFQKQLYKFILQIDNYEMKKAEMIENFPASITIDKRNLQQIYKPQLFTIVPFLEFELFDEKLYIYLKEKFWLSINFPTMDHGFTTKNFSPSPSSPSPPPHMQIDKRLSNNYETTIVKLREELKSVYMSPDIKRYVYSLVVFVRFHRLASLAPKLVRLPTAAIDYIHDLCKTLIVWDAEFANSARDRRMVGVGEQGQDHVSCEQTTHLKRNLFVTPNYVKIAFRKVAYWLVDWEYNKQFVQTDDLDKKEAEEEKELEAEEATETEPKTRRAPGNGKIDEHFQSEILKDQQELENKRLEISMLTGDWYGSEYYYVNEYLKTQKNERDYESPIGYTNKIVEECIESVRPPL